MFLGALADHLAQSAAIMVADLGLFHQARA
jgi:hypothetical protein